MPLKKPLSRLKNVPKSLTKHLKGFDSRFTKFQAKTDTDMLLNSALYRRQMETQSQKNTCIKTVCSQHGVMWQTDGTGFIVTLVSLFIFFHQGSYNNNSPRTFQYKLILQYASTCVAFWSSMLLNHLHVITSVNEQFITESKDKVMEI
jgi:hypothetical protein